MATQTHKPKGERVRSLLALLAIASFLATALPSPALARGPGGRPGPHSQGRYLVHKGGQNFYYQRGHFYQPRGRGYLPARPPRGRVVPVLPVLAASLMVAGITYYTYQNIYYRPVPSGYMVVDRPVQVVVREPAPAVSTVSTVQVTAPALNVRQGPGLEYEALAIVPQGARLPVHASAPGWLYVQIPGGQFGWISQRYTIMLYAAPSG